MKERFALLAPLALFGLAAFLFFYLFLDAAEPGDVRGNLLPELIGFSLEGFFLIGLFSLFQTLRERSRRHELWLSLRSALVDILAQLDLSLLDADAEPLSVDALEQQPRLVQSLADRFESYRPDIDSLVELKKVCQDGQQVLNDLIPVAAQLSARHMRWWLAIADSARGAARAGSRPQLEHQLRRLLLNLREFDALGAE